MAKRDKSAPETDPRGPTPQNDPGDELTHRQAAFVRAYLSNGFNATKAARDAGYAAGTAHAEGSRLLRNVKVVEVLKPLLDAIITPERIKCELAQMAVETDVADFEDWLKGGGTLQELRATGVDTRQIKKIKVTRRVIGHGDEAEPYDDVAIELYDRQAALEKLGRVHAMFTDKTENLNVKISWEEMVKQREAERGGK